MKDVQSDFDPRNIEIDKVGVKNVKYPIVVLDKANGNQHTIATISMFVSLPHHFKGTHMSRFIEVFESYRSDLTMPRFLAMLEEKTKGNLTEHESRFLRDLLADLRLKFVEKSRGNGRPPG